MICDYGDRCPKCSAEKEHEKKVIEGFHNFLYWVWIEALSQQAFQENPERSLRDIRQHYFLMLLDGKFLKLSW